MPAPTPKSDQLAKLKYANWQRLYGKGAKKVVAPAPEKMAIAKVALSTTLPTKKPLSTAERQAKWRDTHPEVARERRRTSMRKLREKSNV